MRRSYGSLAFLILLGAQQAPSEQKKPPTASPDDLYIERALFWITDRDMALRDVARKQLVQFGPKAFPAIEERLKARGVLDLVNVLRKIERPSQSYVTPEDLAKDGKSVHLTMPLKAGQVFQLTCNGKGTDGKPMANKVAWYTLNKLRK